MNTHAITTTDEGAVILRAHTDSLEIQVLKKGRHLEQSIPNDKLPDLIAWLQQRRAEYEIREWEK